jgi:excisionase family DNA binding protein
MELEALDPAKAINLQRDLETVEQFAERNGLEEGVVRAWVYRGNLPTTKIGKRRLINSALLRQSLLEEEWVR